MFEFYYDEISISEYFKICIRCSIHLNLEIKCVPINNDFRLDCIIKFLNTENIHVNR